MSSAQKGFLLIADISGYTSYLSSSELEHAQVVLASLLTLLIDHTRPPLTITRTAGDAVISYALESSRLHGQTLMELNEQTYAAFRKAIDRMVMNNTCRCNACANVSSLDLKFFVHHGSFVVQRLGAHDELVGADVNLLHRLLKNDVVEVTSVRAYTLFTEAALAKMGLEGVGAGLLPHVQTIPGMGEVKTWVQDMRPVWERLRAVNAVTLPPDRELARVETEIAAPPETVWDYLLRPEARAVLWGADRHEASDLEQGRVAAGSGFLCYHGDHVVTQTVLEWQPFERVLIETLIPVPVKNVYALTEFQLAPSERGTRFTQLTGKARGPFLGRLMADRGMRKMIAASGRQDLEKFRDFVQAGVSAAAAEAVPA